jgi:hypothetical protein
MTVAADGFIESGVRDIGVCNIHLVSGEDIIGHVFDKTDPATGGEYYVINKPVIPNVGMDRDKETGQPRFQVGLLPLRPYLGNLPQVELAKAYVMYIVKVNPQMEKMYIEFTTGIVLAGPGDVPKVTL